MRSEGWICRYDNVVQALRDLLPENFLEDIAQVDVRIRELRVRGDGSAVRGDRAVEISELLQGVELVSGRFEEVMNEAGEDDQVYCDPPYVPLSKTASFTGYCAGGFGYSEQKRLAESAQKAALRGARVVLSNHDLPVVRNDLYPECNGFAFVGRPRVKRAISRNAQRRHAVNEVIASIGPLLERVA